MKTLIYAAIAAACLVLSGCAALQPYDGLGGANPPRDTSDYPPWTQVASVVAPLVPKSF
jgi:hypothetical protein